MEKKYRVAVYGKAGCDKCKTLNKRLDTLLTKPEWTDFEKVYCDLETEDGLVSFCKAECLNPNRVPAFVVQQKTGDRYEPMRNPHPGRTEGTYASSRLYTLLGMQTDYSETGRGLLTPDMITTVLAEARQS